MAYNVSDSRTMPPNKASQIASTNSQTMVGRRSLTEFLSLVRGAHPNNPARNQHVCQKALESRYKSGLVVTKESANGQQLVTKAAMSELSGLTGGYLLPQDYSDALLNVIAEEGFIYPRATVIPMFSADLQAPRFDAETAPTVVGVSPFFGGVTFRWGAEEVPAETEPTFRMGSFHAWDLIGYLVVSNQWLQDAGAVQSTPDSLLKAEHYLIRMLGRAAAWQAEYAFLRGLGAAQQMPLGIVQAPGSAILNRTAANEIRIADVVGMTSRLLPHSWNNAIWAVSPTALVQVQQLTQYSINQYADYADRPKPRPVGVLSSRPLFVTEKLAALGRRGDLVLFDPSLYIITQRMEVTVDVSPDDLFQTNQTVYRVWMRLDGKPMTSSTITLADTTTVVSPYVVLN